MIKLPLESELEKKLESLGINFMERLYPEDIRRTYGFVGSRKDPRNNLAAPLIPTIDRVQTYIGTDTFPTMAGWDDGYDFFYRVSTPNSGLYLEYWSTINQRYVDHIAAKADELIKRGKVKREIVLFKSEENDYLGIVSFEKEGKGYKTSIEFDFGEPPKNNTELMFTDMASPILKSLEGGSSPPAVIADSITKVIANYKIISP